MLKFLLSLLGAAALIGIGVGIGALIFLDEDEEAGPTLSDRLNDLRQGLGGDIDAIVNGIERNEDISPLRVALVERCLDEQERLREDREGTAAAEELGDICDEIQNAPDNATEQWEDIQRRLDEL